MLGLHARHLVAAIAGAFGFPVRVAKVTAAPQPSPDRKAPRRKGTLVIPIQARRRPRHEDPMRIIRAAARRRRRTILRAENIAKGWAGTYPRKAHYLPATTTPLPVCP